MTTVKYAQRIALELDIDELEPHVTPLPGGPVVHAEAPDNVAYDWSDGDEASVEAAIASAARVVTVPVEDSRIIVASMEPRGAYAEPIEGGSGQAEIW